METWHTTGREGNTIRVTTVNIPATGNPYRNISGFIVLFSWKGLFYFIYLFLIWKILDKNQSLKNQTKQKKQKTGHGYDVFTVRVVFVNLQFKGFPKWGEIYGQETAVKCRFCLPMLWNIKEGDFRANQKKSICGEITVNKTTYFSKQGILNC